MGKKDEGLSLPPWLYLSTDDYDAELVTAQDIVERMRPQEKKKAMETIAAAFQKAGGK